MKKLPIALLLRENEEVVCVDAPAVVLYSSNLLYNHKNSFIEAAMKRPVSKLTKAVQQISKRQRKETDLYLGGRWNHLDLTLAVCNHLHVTGFDSNGFETWGESRDLYDCYLQQGRELVNSPDEVFREGLYYACYWWDGVGKLTGEQLAGLISLLNDLAEMQGAQAEQGGPDVGQEIPWEPKFIANQKEAGTSKGPT